MTAAQRQAWRECKDALVAAGLCIDCKETATRGQRCARCAETNVRAATRHRERRRIAGKCVTCPLKARPNRSQCQGCAEDTAARRWLRERGLGRGRRRALVTQDRVKRNAAT